MKNWVCLPKLENCKACAYCHTWKITTTAILVSPIALASCVGKVMEKLVRSRLKWYIERKYLYPPSMNSFRRESSSIDNVLDLRSSVQHAKSTKDITIAVFLDIKGAFDDVHHDDILQMLTVIGIVGRVYAWVEDYLRDRMMYISTRDGDTTFYQINNDVPQEEEGGS